MDTRKLRFCKADFLVIAATILLAIIIAVVFIPRSDTSEAVVQIYQDGTLIREVSLQEDFTLTLAGTYKNTIQIQNGRVAIIASDCPGEDCVHTGWISTPGTSIVCLPNRVEIRIVGKSDVDLIVG